MTQGYAIDGGKAPDFFNSLRIRRDGEMLVVRAHRKADLKDRDLVIQKTAGGCGVGDPFTRDPGMVLEDVRNGYVSIAGAQRDYGVAIDTETFAIDEEGTMRLREGAARDRPTRGSLEVRQDV